MTEDETETQRPPPPLSPPTIDQLNEWGVRFVIAMRSSIDSDKIKPLDWPARIVAALETGAVSDHYSGMVSSVARKLQATPLQARTASELRVLEDEIREANGFEDLRRHIEREAAYLEAWAREQRKTERAAEDLLRAQSKGKPKKIVSPYTAGRDATERPSGGMIDDDSPHIDTNGGGK